VSRIKEGKHEKTISHHYLEHQAAVLGLWPIPSGAIFRTSSELQFPL